jgi:hypothetical protein
MTGTEQAVMNDPRGRKDTKNVKFGEHRTGNPNVKRDRMKEGESGLCMGVAPNLSKQDEIVRVEVRATLMIVYSKEKMGEVISERGPEIETGKEDPHARLVVLPHPRPVPSHDLCPQ